MIKRLRLALFLFLFTLLCSLVLVTGKWSQAFPAAAGAYVPPTTLEPQWGTDILVNPTVNPQCDQAPLSDAGN